MFEEFKKQLLALVDRYKSVVKDKNEEFKSQGSAAPSQTAAPKVETAPAKTETPAPKVETAPAPKVEEAPAKTETPAPKTEAAPTANKDGKAAVPGKLLYEDIALKRHGQAFIDKVKVVAGRIGIDPNFMMATMYVETIHTFRTDIQSPKTKATGLIQFMPKTAEGLGTTIEKLAAMNGVDQLDWVEKYYKQFGSLAKKIKEPAESYFLVFYPAAIGKPDDFVLGSENKDPNRAALVAKQNPAYDTNKDGKITKGEVLEYQRKNNYKQIYLDLASSETEAPAASGDATTTDSSSKLGSTVAKGAKGADAKHIQELLIKAGYDLGKWGADGEFGATSEGQLKKFQADKGLPVTGSVAPGDATYKALSSGSSTAPAPTGDAKKEEAPDAKKEETPAPKGGGDDIDALGADIPQGKDTWDKHTNQRVQQLQGGVKNAALNFVNEVQKTLNIKLRITSTLRTVEEQDALYKKGGVTKAQGGQSYHNYGLAIDVCIINGSSADFNITSAIAAVGKKMGFEWGGDWKGFVDKPHFQMTFGKSIEQLCIAKYPDRARKFGYLKGDAPAATTTPAATTKDGKDAAPTDTTKGADLKGNNPIKQSVGDAGAANDPQDVITVQRLLNQKYNLKVAETGEADAKLKAAIRQFQEKVVKLAKPDGRIDAGGKSWKALAGEATAPATTDSAPPANAGGPVSTPSWISKAKAEIGQKEIKGDKDNPRIVEYHSTTGGFSDDETPWCASFVNWCMVKGGYSGTGSARALDWAKYGKESRNNQPAFGAIAVKSRKGGGHVGFVVGKQGNKLLILGGNQSDQVMISRYSASDFHAFRFPSNYNIPENAYFLAEGTGQGDAGTEA